MNQANVREHKDRLFRYLFGNPKYKGNTLSLYNALNGTNYQNPDDLQFSKLENAFFVGMKNDVSFMIADEINVWEQQSSWNENMPLRELIYYVDLIRKQVEINDRNALYRKKRYMIPVPRLYVFYNGREDKPEEQWLYLHDSFEGDGERRKDADPDIAVRVRMININSGENGNQSLLKKCPPLSEYAQMVSEIREKEKEVGLEEAVKTVLNNVPKTYVISEAIEDAKEELMDAVFGEFDEEKYWQDVKEEALEEGRKEGLEMGREEGREMGREEGREEGHKAGQADAITVMRLIKKGYSDQEISAQVNGCTPEYAAEVRAEMIL